MKDCTYRKSDFRSRVDTHCRVASSLLRSVAGLIFAALAVRGVASAQQVVSSQPALAPCGTIRNKVEVLCGTYAPEDLEPTPDGKFLVVAQFEEPGSSGEGRGMALFDVASKTFSKLTMSVEPQRDWGSAACPGPLGHELDAHGIALNKRTNGVLELYVINHNRRESMEMYELRPAGSSWTLVWHGCVVSPKEYNDVAALPDGGFISSYPTALLTGDKQKDDEAFSTGKPIGYVVRWTQKKGLQELPNTRVGFPNGVLVSPDGRFMYLNAWTAREVHKYDLQQLHDVQVTKLDFMPDNLSWVDPHLNRRIKGDPILAAGVKASRGDCPEGSGHPCVTQFGVAEINPITMKSKMIYHSAEDDALISSVSVAVEVNNSLYIGAYKGYRLLRIDLKR